MNLSIEVSRKISRAYNAMCKPLCKELELSQTAFDILMFLGNNPNYNTAGEIVEIRRIKANLVSVNVERLVREGYLLRKQVEGDRRKTGLICTDKAKPIIERGRKLQKAFTERMFLNMDDDLRKAFSEATDIIEKNLNEILKTENKL